MKKIIFTLLALVGTMSMNAQVIEVYKGETLVKQYKAGEATHVEFGEAPAFSSGQGEAEATGVGYVTWVQLWKGGPKFAEYNVGVIDGKAESYGGRYSWGGSIDMYPFDYYTGSNNLEGDTDTATKLWGSNWRMPTQEELTALHANCNCEWTTQNSVAGMRFTGKDDYANNSIFIPATGMYHLSPLEGQTTSAYFWTSTHESGTNNMYYQYFDSSKREVNLSNDKKYCLSVRAVLKETPTTGTTKRKGDIEVNWIQLWEGGPKFAEYNVGATSATEHGGYYTWGGTYQNGEGIAWNDDHNTGTEALTGDTDTATKLWGSNWRMPTKDEWIALKNNCTYSWTTQNSVKGILFTGKGNYSSNSIFLPAAGYCQETAIGGYIFSGGKGHYWSSTPSSISNAAKYAELADILYMSGDDPRDRGLSVRPVLK